MTFYLADPPQYRLSGFYLSEDMRETDIDGVQYIILPAEDELVDELTKYFDTVDLDYSYYEEGRSYIDPNSTQMLIMIETQ